MKSNVTISIRITAETKTELDRIAASEMRTVSQLGRILVEEALVARRERTKPRSRKAER